METSDEITLEDMFGDVPQGGKPTPPQPGAPPNIETISLADMGLNVGGPAIEADKGFFERTWENMQQLNEEGKQEFLQNPLRAYYSLPWGAAKSLVGGTLSMARASVGGLLGLGSMATGGQFDEGPEAVDKFLKKDEELSKGILYINLAPQTKIEEGFNQLLSLLPEGIAAAGDTVYEKTGSALVGAGAQGLLTLLTFKPSMAVKPFGAFKGVVTGERVTAEAKKAGTKVSSAVDELAVTDPQAVEALRDHVKGADPELGELLDKAMKEAKDKSPEKIGEEAAKETVPAELPKPSGPAYTLADAGNGQLKIIRRDGKWESKPIADKVEAKLQVEKLNDMAEKNAEIRNQAIKLNEAAKGASVAVEQGMKALAELPIAPDVKMTSVERRSALRKSNEDYAKQLLEEEHQRAKTEGVKVYRGLRGDKLEDINPAEGREGYSTFFSSSPDVAASYGQPIHDTAGAVFPLKIHPEKIIEFPVKKVSGAKGNEFDKFKFDEAAKNLKPGEALVARQVYDVGPAASRLTDPEGKFSYPSDVWAIGKGTKTSSPFEAKAFEVVGASLEPPGLKLAKGKLTEYYDQIIRTVNPEALGREAKTAASVLAKHIAIQMQRESTFTHRAAERRMFWERELGRNPEQIREFLDKYEKGEKQKTPVYEAAAKAYKDWNEKIYKQDQALGIDYKPADNYLFHIFKDSRGVADYFRKKYGPKWGNPQFTKDRQFEMIKEAKKAGYEPRFENPEDIMLARQHASDIAQMQVGALREMEKYGVATKVAEGVEQPPSTHEWRAPNGERFWVHDGADAVLHNAFNTKSLWAMKGIGGDLFRGAMFLKNSTVPVVLALSLFHPLHVATIANATGMVRASKLLLSGKMSPAKFMKEMVEAGVYKDLAVETGGQLASGLLGAEPRGGNRLLKAYQGKLSDAEITPADRLSLQLMAEGGFIPEMAAQYKTNSIVKLQTAIARRSATALWHLPFAAISAMQKPMFEVWIPSLKIASYMKDVKTALTTDPTLYSNQSKRQQVFRQLAKSVDNRYGEMAYSTLFWNRWVKDLGVANTLSLGWQLGFLREYGGGMLDLAKAPLSKGSFRQKIAKSDLDRPMFVAYYTAQALAYGGLLTWAMTGEQPQDLNDYIYPRTGETTPNGRAERVNTMFYPREFASIYHHVEKEGLAGGLGHLASSKASGVVGLTSQWASGVNSFGQEIRDPDATPYKQLEQMLAATLEELQPISIEAIRNSTELSKKSIALNVSGFSPAPKYVTETKTEALITGTFRKYFSKTQTPYERAQYSDDRAKLRKAYDNGDSDKYSEILDKIQRDHELTGMEVRRLERSIARGSDPLVAMFSRLTWMQQKKILDQMTDDEREVYLPMANKEHLRYSYEPPEK